MSFGAATSSVTQLSKQNTTKQYGFVKTDFIDFILKIDVEIHKIRSAISVKYFGPKEGVPLETSWSICLKLAFRACSYPPVL
jgi:hypothetical protein